MSYVTQSLARQRALSDSYAQAQAINAGQALQDLAANGGNDMRALHQKELQLQLQKEQAELKAKVAKEQKKALDKKKKLDTYA